MVNTEYKRTPMFHSRILAPTLVLVLLLAGCIMPARQDAPPPAEPPMAEPAPTPTPEELMAVVNQNVNVRTGPGTDYAVAYWLTAGDAVTVVGRNADSTWLQIEHQDRPGWIFATLLDIAAEPEAPPEAAETAPELTPKPELEPEAVETAPEPTPLPTPAPEPQPATPARVTATVIGTVVNLRRGPGTDYPTDGQVRAGEQLLVTGRNADGSWLQIVHPAATGEHIWIYAPLTDIDVAAALTLAEVEAPPAAEAATPIAAPEPTAEPTHEPVPEPQAAPPSATPAPPADCTQWHTVNPNEKRLSQITDWYGLDLATIAQLNGLDANAPLTTGHRICLGAGSRVEPQTPAATHEPVEEPASGALDFQPVLGLDFPVHPLSMDVQIFGACAIRADGSAACWKAFEHSQREPPPGVYSQVEVGAHFACGLRNDATVHCWGGIEQAPPGRYVELIAGNTHACGLTASGRIDCWGENFHNQATPPSGSFRSLGDGDLHSCAIQTDEKVVCWGLVDSSDKPPNKRFQSISGGANYTCGLLLNGELECWGTHTRPVTPPRGKFTSFATGAYHACALRSNGEMVCWGDNREGEGSPPPGPWKTVACGFDETCGVRIDGTMECWGSGW